MSGFTSQSIIQAESHLAKVDPVMKALIKQYGPCHITPHRNYYDALVNSIVGQQLSVKAAAAIRQRFLNLFGSDFPTPEDILTKSVSDFRTIGFSNAKAAYIRDLAQHIIDGRVRFDKLAKQSNETIIDELTDVKGIGEWTVHMFLLFCVGRLDILPTGDLGIRTAIGRLYGYPERPNPSQVRETADKQHWQPYASVASWYLWQSLNNAPIVND